ncbi:MAG: hypothetical protein H7A48_09705 [Akkermansiaceae bacterium]|nr:hypothetical protein [Akkermansiaceae bacterium]
MTTCRTSALHMHWHSCCTASGQKCCTAWRSASLPSRTTNSLRATPACKPRALSRANKP